MLVTLLFALAGLALAKEYFPRDAPSLEGDFAMYPDLLSLFKVQLSANKDVVRRVLNNIRDTYLTPTVYDRIVANISVRNSMSDAFADIVPGASSADYFILNAVAELASDSMLAVAETSEYEGTMLGYGETISSSLTFARALYDDMQDLIYDIYFREGDNSAYASSFVGSAGFTLVRVNGIDVVLTRVLDYNASSFPALSNDADFRRAVEVLARNLSEGNGHLLGEVLATVLFSMVKKAAPAEDLVSWILAEGNNNLALPYFLGIAYTDRLAALVVSTADLSYVREIPGADPENPEWRLIQSTQRYNFEKPKQSDFAIIQMERAFDESLGGPCSFSAFTNQLRSYPFRSTYTAFLTGASKTSGSDRLQKCTSIVDAEGSIVACADPAPPENWWVIIISLLLIAAVIAIWVLGCKFSKMYERGELDENGRRLGKSKGKGKKQSASADYVQISDQAEQKKD